MNSFRRTLFVLLSFTTILTSQSRPQPLTGTIDGVVIDADTRTPLVGANVLAVNTVLGAITDHNGKFSIANVPVGNYSVQFRMVGYSTVTKTDVIVRSQRNTTITAELQEHALESEQVVVTAGYFSADNQRPVSITTLSAEEIRRAPGSGGDISRVLMTLPSLAKVNDQSNALIVRGGSPLENAFYLDGIEIPNINHFPTQGATGGPIGMINVDLIDAVQFSSGGFSPAFGDKMSSVLELTLRDGNREQFDAQFDLGIMGFGGAAEGPIGENGSFIVSVRRSYLDYLVSMFDIGTTVAPRYGDVQGKISYDLSAKHRLSLLFIGGDDQNNPSRAVAEENDMLYYGNQNIGQYSGGVVWRALWSGDLFSNTTVGIQTVRSDEDFFETNTGAPVVGNHSAETVVALRNSNHLRLHEQHSLEFGAEVKRSTHRYDNMFGAYSDAVGDSTPAFRFAQNVTTEKFGAFLTYTVLPMPGFSATIGARTDYFSYNDRWTVSPCIALSYRFDERSAVHVASGMYHQSMPPSIIAPSLNGSSLRDPYAVHYIVGADHLLSEDTKLSVEVYMKEYYDYPVDPSDPSLFLVDEIFYRNGLYFGHSVLANDGAARSRGIEVTVQKKLAHEFYGIAGISYFRSEYRGGDNVWRNRVFDNRLIVSAEGGYKPNGEWEFSARWIYAGGSPYTPFDLAASAQQQRGVFDAARINGERYPAYHSMNVRFDKRFHFDQSTLVVYLSAWNVYNRRNVAGYFWNEKENGQGTLYQWNLLPIFGVEYEL